MNNAVHINWVDYTLLAIIGLSFVISVFRGFLREAISLISWAAAFILSLKYSTAVGGLMQAHVHSKTLSYSIAFIVIFLCIIILGMVVNAIVHALIDKSGISFIDRLLGAVFGIARGVLLICMVLMFVNLSTLKDNKAISASWSVKLLNPLVTWLGGYIPKGVGDVSSWLDQNNKNKGSTQSNDLDKQ